MSRKSKFHFNLTRITGTLHEDQYAFLIISCFISWLGHVERMGDRMPKKIFTQELEGARRRGRPRKGWKEEVERDLQVMGVRRWRELVIDREKWKGHVRQAKAHSGL
jgi:hypothetical protein